MSILQKFILALSISFMVSSTAHSECRRAHVCDDYGQNCRYMDICEDALDLPSVDIDPLPSLPTTDIKPLPSLELPPLGTSKCEYKLVDGRWQNICS